MSTPHKPPLQPIRDTRVPPQARPPWSSRRQLTPRQGPPGAPFSGASNPECLAIVGGRTGLAIRLCAWSALAMDERRSLRRSTAWRKPERADPAGRHRGDGWTPAEQGSGPRRPGQGFRRALKGSPQLASWRAQRTRPGRGGPRPSMPQSCVERTRPGQRLTTPATGHHLVGPAGRRSLHCETATPTTAPHTRHTSARRHSHSPGSTPAPRAWLLDAPALRPRFPIASPLFSWLEHRPWSLRAPVRCVDQANEAARHRPVSIGDELSPSRSRRGRSRR